VRLGAACAGAGTLVHAIAELVLGGRGMPRRYVAYVPDFVTGHRVAAAGAALAAAGLALLAAAWLRGTPRVSAAGTPRSG
jgi:heme/copper-type cytochrome/quinol oxidase subunit 1